MGENWQVVNEKLNPVDQFWQLRCQTQNETKFMNFRRWDESLILFWSTIKRWIIKRRCVGWADYVRIIKISNVKLRFADICIWVSSLLQTKAADWKKSNERKIRRIDQFIYDDTYMKHRYIKNEIIIHKCSYTERITNFPCLLRETKERKGNCWMENSMREWTLTDHAKYAHTCWRSHRDPCDLSENEISKIRYLNKEGPEGTEYRGTSDTSKKEERERGWNWTHIHTSAHTKKEKKARRRNGGWRKRVEWFYKINSKG